MTHTNQFDRESEADQNHALYTEGAGSLLVDDVPDAPVPKLGWGSYDPADDKIRIRPHARFDGSVYARVKAAGFKWAPKQGLFVAPCWTPQREALAIELCGELEDEGTTLEERAEQRAERFEVYSDKRAVEAHRAKDAVAAIADGIPTGQPIIRGHHSEKRARKDAERIEAGMKRAVRLWETSQYWESRAERSKAHAKFKELPTVRARRVKTLEADKRKHERALDQSERLQKLWHTEPLTLELALRISNESYQSFCFPLDKYPRNPPLSQYEGSKSLWSALSDGVCTAEQARDLALPGIQATIDWAKRWAIHLSMRLIYESCMLEESGYVEPPKVKSAKQTLPLCNYKADTITYPNDYHRGQETTLQQVEMTKAQYAKVGVDYRGTRIVDRSHKVRIAVLGGGKRVAVFLTDSKVHERPGAGHEPAAPAPRMPRAPYVPPARTEFDDIKDSLKAGVKLISAPQLFPTPRDVAARMVDLAEIEDGHRVLEPSAGTGVIAEAIGEYCAAHGISHELRVIEINGDLCALLRQKPRGIVTRGDFLEFLSIDLGGLFDVVVMNPPFAHDSTGARGPADIAHIHHAISLTKSGGRVVAICANGPRQREALEPLAESWEELPAGTFASSGTNVSTVLAVFVVEGGES